MKTKSARRNVFNDLTTLENTLKRKLLAFYNKNIKPRASDTTIEQLMAKYNAYITNLIRKTVQESYLTAHDIMGKQIKIEDFDITISVTDASNMEIITAAMVQSFWKTAQRLNGREIEYKLTQDQELVKKAPFDRNAAMVATAALVVYDSFNNSIKNKSQELGNQVEFVTARDADVDPNLCRPLDGNIYEDGQVPFNETPPLHRHCRCTLIPIETTI